MSASSRGASASEPSIQTRLARFKPRPNPKRRNMLIFAAFVFAAVCAIYIPLSGFGYGSDYDVYDRAGRGDLTDYFYPYWLLPAFSVFQLFPREIGWVIWNLVNLAGAFYAVRVFGGGKGLLLISYPLIMTFFYGQIGGLIAAATAWMYRNIQKERAWLVGVAWVLAATKPQIGLMLGGMLLWMYAKPRMWFQAGAVVLGVFLVSQVLWPLWIVEWAERTFEQEPAQAFDFTSWNYIGGVVVLLWLPVLIAKTQDFTWAAATLFLTLPYVWPFSLVSLMVHPLGGLGWLFQVNYFLGPSYSYLFLLPPLLLYLRSAYRWWRGGHPIRRSWADLGPSPQNAPT